MKRFYAEPDKYGIILLVLAFTGGLGVKRKQVIFVTVGLVLIFVVSGGIYLNYQLDRVVKSLSRPGLLFVDTETTAGMDDTDITNPADGTSDGADSGSSSDIPGTSGTPGKIPGGSSASGTIDTGTQGVIVDGVESKVGRPIENKDLLRAGLIILKRLDRNEISYLFEVGSQDNYSKEDLQQIRKVLKSKLTDEDIAVLQALGSKYGKTLKVLGDEEIK